MAVFASNIVWINKFSAVNMMNQEIPAMNDKNRKVCRKLKVLVMIVFCILIQENDFGD